MKQITKERQKEILSKSYLTMADIYELLPIGRNQSNELFHQIEEEVKEDGKKLFITRPRVIPTSYYKRYMERERL